MRARLRWCAQDPACSAWRRVPVLRPGHGPGENESPSDGCVLSDRTLPRLLVLVGCRRVCGPADEYPPLVEIPCHLRPASKLQRPWVQSSKTIRNEGGTALDLQAILAP